VGERCERCDKPVATDNDWVTTPEGDGEHLCRGSAVCASVDWRARALAAETERDALRAIVEGRTTAPTPTEVAAHPGPWLVLFSDDGIAVEPARFLRIYAARIKNGSPMPHPVRFWPLRDGRLCAWPEVPRG
jgi:hypothetical protein